MNHRRRNEPQAPDEAVLDLVDSDRDVRGAGLEADELFVMDDEIAEGERTQELGAEARNVEPLLRLEFADLVASPEEQRAVGDAVHLDPRRDARRGRVDVVGVVGLEPTPRDRFGRVTHCADGSCRLELAEGMGGRIEAPGDVIVGMRR